MSVTWNSAGQYSDIRYELGGGENAGIAKITINRPEVRNAFRPETVVELADAFTRAREDLEVGVVILTGEGPDAFCSGGDQRVRGRRGGYVTGVDPAEAGKHEAVGRFERDEDFCPGLEETVESLPDVAENRRSAGGRFEQPAGGTVAHLGHGSTRHVERDARGRVKGGVFGRGKMPDEEDVFGPGKLDRILCPADQKSP